MKNIITNKRGEASVKTALIIIISVVIGALLLGGLYLLFAGDNGVMAQADNKVYDMFNTGNAVTLKHEGEQLLYSYDGETWKQVKVTGLTETGRITKYITLTSGEGDIHLVCIQNDTGYVISRSVDGKEWTPVRTSSESMSLSSKNGGTYAFLSYSNGMSYTSSDGINWTVHSTPNY